MMYFEFAYILTLEICLKLLSKRDWTHYFVHIEIIRHENIAK